MKNASTQSEKKFQKVMHEFGQGTLKSHDKPVKDQKQALAIAFSEARKIHPTYGMKMAGGEMTEKMANGGIAGAELEKIYKTGTAKQLWEAWTNQERIHFLMDHATEFFELMGDDFYKSSDAFSTLTYDALPSPIRKSVVVHHAQGMYREGGDIEKYSDGGGSRRKIVDKSSKKSIITIEDIDDMVGSFMQGQSVEKVHKRYTNLPKSYIQSVYDKTNEGASNKSILEEVTEEMEMNNGGEISQKLSPAKKKLLKRINTLKGTLQNASPGAQKAIQKKIDVLQKRFDYTPSAKERAMANKGKFALDVPTKYRQFIYKKLWGMKIFPRIHTLNGTSSIVVNNKINLDKAYRIYSDMLKEKGESVPTLSKISRKL